MALNPIPVGPIATLPDLDEWWMLEQANVNDDPDVLVRHVPALVMACLTLRDRVAELEAKLDVGSAR